jgi:hypothetical protein
MKNKIIGITICMLLLATSVNLVFNEKPLRADQQTGNNQDLNLPYLWTWIKTACKNITKVYNQSEIMKGRFYGSKGCIYTAKILENEMKDNLSLENVNRTAILHINSTDPIIDAREYTTIIDTTAYNLTVNNNTYFFTNPIPQDQFFPVACAARRNESLTYNSKFDHVSLFYNNLQDIIPQDWFNGSYLITNYEASIYSENPLWGKLEYLALNQTAPSDQQGIVFLLEDKEENQDLFNNLSGSEGCILIHDNSFGQSLNLAGAMCVVNKINLTDGEILRQIIRNHPDAFCYNYTDGIHVNYDFNLSIYPEKFFVIDRIPGYRELANSTGHLINLFRHRQYPKPPYPCPNLMGYIGCIGTWMKYYVNVVNRVQPRCQGFILYSSYDQHPMFCTTTLWGSTDDGALMLNREPMVLPSYLVNYSLGTFLNSTRHGGTKISGNITQHYYKESSSTPGVEVYDIIGELNIPKSPGDKRIYLSNRYDGMWGPTPGDSGLGTAVVIALAKQLKSLEENYSVKPKYNLTFLFTSGEEFGSRGAQYLHDKMVLDESINKMKLMIAFDQLGMNQADVPQAPQFGGNENNASLNRQIVWIIANDTHYDDRSNNKFEPCEVGNDEGCEWVVWGKLTDPKVDCIQFVRDNEYRRWDRWHSTGDNYTAGDSLNFTDPVNVNITYELAWNVTKYFCLNPNCRFDDVTFKAIDSPNDGDSLNDSILANFTIASSLPRDNVRVMADISLYSNQLQQYWNYTLPRDFVVTRNGTNISWTLPVLKADYVVNPEYFSEADCQVQLHVLNSTGRIDYIVSLAGVKHYNDSSDESLAYHLYHPFGSDNLGINSQTVADNISGTVFKLHEDATANNITRLHPDLEFTVFPPGNPKMKCMIYRASDGNLMGTTEEKNWLADTFNFTNPKPVLTKNTDYILSIWANNTNSYLYYNNSIIQQQGRYYQCTYGSTPEQVTFHTTKHYCSLYCSYSPPQLPRINSVSNQPSIGGFGQNITITANITEGDLPIGGVNVTVQHLANIETYPMVHLSGAIYEYVYANGWTTGQYNYTISAYDTQSHTNTSQQYSFNISANATISVSTLKDTYTNANEWINITDPPEIPESYTLISQGVTWNKYAAPDGDHNILETSTTPINYQDQTGTWNPINQTIRTLNPSDIAYTYGYRAGNERGLFSTYFKPSLTDTWPVAFAYSRSQDPTLTTVRTKLIGVGYLDPTSNWDYHILQNTQNSQGQLNGNTITYPGAFTGTDLTMSYGVDQLKEALVMSNTTKAVLQSHPPSLYGLSNSNSYLVFITKIDAQNLALYNATQQITGDVTLTGNGIDFKTALNEFRCAMPLGEAYELNNEAKRQDLTLRVVHYNGETYILAGLRLADLSAMTYPVVIDPSITIYSSSQDGYIYNSNANYNTASSASTGTVVDTSTSINIGQRPPGISPAYTIYRAFLIFDTAQLPSNAVIDNATLGLYKVGDYSTTDFDITVQNGQPTYPHTPLAAGDYAGSHYSGNGGTFNTANFASGFNNIALNSQGLSWIMPKDKTKLCLRSSRDINRNAPTSNEYVTITSNEFTGFGCQPRLVIWYRNQSKIKNTGTTDIKGYLLMQVQYHQPLGIWTLDNEVINDTSPRTINAGNQLGLDTIFNGLIQVSDLIHGDGTYRVYVAFRDPDGNVLMIDANHKLEATWQFTVDT